MKSEKQAPTKIVVSDRMNLTRPIKESNHTFSDLIISSEMNPIEKEEHVVFVGKLDYDPNVEPLFKAGIRPQIHIREVFQSPLQANIETAFKERHENMQEDADEHYLILVMLQKVDEEFDRQLRMNYFRKKEVQETLKMSENWSRFTKRI